MLTPSGSLSLDVRVERFPMRGSHTNAQGTKRNAVVVVATLSDGIHTGRGECVPRRRYGGTIEGVVANLEKCAKSIGRGLSLEDLPEILPAGPARNALDCAFWDLEAKKQGQSVAALAGLEPLKPVPTAFTISLGPPEKMALEAQAASAVYPLLKLKLGRADDRERLRAVREAAPHARLIGDVNEAWRPENVESLLDAAASAGVELIEQPLPARCDDVLERIDRPVPVCADESIHDRASLGRNVGRYDAINIKLDKTGGLSEALLLAESARSLGLEIMVGCMLATSLSMAPAILVAQDADWVDLDAPLVLARDRHPGVKYDSGLIFPPPPEFWG